MLHHIPNITLQSIFFHFILHNDAHIKAFKVYGFRKAHKWLLIVFFFENSLSQIVKLEIIIRNFGQCSTRCGQLTCHSLMPLPYHHASTNDLFSNSCIKISTKSNIFSLYITFNFS
jgi:hypothetical protein